MSKYDLNMAHGVIRTYVQMSYSQYLKGNREQLVEACANYLTDTKHYPKSIGIKVAIKEIATYESICLGADIDLDRCTDSLIVIHNRRNGTRHFYTVDDILQTAAALAVRPITN